MTADRSLIRKAVVPAAGYGTRLRPLTNIAPKELLPLGVKPTVEYIVEELQAVGIQDIIFVVAPHKTGIQEYFGNSACDGAVRLSYVVQDVQLGLAHAILQAEEAVGGEHFVVALGDTVIVSDEPEIPAERLLNAYRSMPAFAAVAVESVPAAEVYKYGIVKPVDKVEDPFEINGVVEKPRVGEAPSEYAIGGRYVFGPDMFDWVRRTPAGFGGEQQITDSIRLALSGKERVWCVPLRAGEKRYDIGSFESYCEAFVAMCMRDPDLGSVVRRSIEGGSTRPDPPGGIG